MIIGCLNCPDRFLSVGPYFQVRNNVIKTLITLGVSSLFLVSCQEANDGAAASAQKDTAPDVAASDGPICDRYFAFVENYAGKQEAAVKDALLKRLDYDKQSLPTRDKAEADAYCKQSLERMERMAG
jgi:hypothetical protein